MDIELVFPEASERSSGRKKTFIYWELIKNYMESNDMDTNEKVLLCERLAEVLKADAVTGSNKKYTET